jgi:hypothetical protein
MAPDAAFEAIADRLLGEPGIEEGTGFGSSPGLRSHGRIFAMLVRDRFVVKLPVPRCADLVSSGTARAWDRGQGRPLKEWIVIADAAQSQWLAVAEEALAFARPS